MSFRTARLEDVCEINPRAPKKINDNTPVSFLPMSAVSEDGYVAFEEARTYGEVKKGYTYFERGDVLVAKITPCFENGKAASTEAIQNKIGFGSTEFHVLRPLTDLDPKYAFYLLWSDRFRTIGEKGMTGSAGQKRVPADLLRRLEIPLPPLEEQKRITAILDKADQLRQKRRQAIALLDSLTQSIFLEMFGDPVSNPKCWEVQRLGDCVTIDAPLVDPRLPQYQDLLHYGPDRIEKDTGRLLAAQTALQDKLISKKFLCDERHILYSKIRPYLNKVAVSPGDCLCSADMYPIEPLGSAVDKFYLLYMLRSKRFLTYADGCSGRSSIPKINRDQLLNFQMPCPEVSLQRKFRSRVEHLEVNRAKQEASLKKIEQSFDSIQNRAFSGQL